MATLDLACPRSRPAPGLVLSRTEDRWLKKREKWRLPKTFKIAKAKKGLIQRHDGEPQFFELTKHANDRGLTTNTIVACCDCGLTHNYVYNIFKAKRTWYLGVRAYRLPDTKKK